MIVIIDYNGRAVHLTDERWQHMLQHLELVGLEAFPPHFDRT